ATDSQSLAVGTDPHHGVVDVAISWIEDIAVLIDQPVTLHVSDQRQSEQRLVLAVVAATRTGLILGILRPQKQLCDHAVIDRATLYEEERTGGLAGLLVPLLPQAGDGGLRRNDGLGRRDCQRTRKQSGRKKTRCGSDSDLCRLHCQRSPPLDSSRLAD